MTKITVGVVGNPNCGKTTLFNALTGARQRVGNWTGVTVERKSGTYRDGEATVEVVDLPGVYSLSVVPGMDNIDEKIGRDYILSGEPDVVVNIVDAGNLERNLYLTAQALEMRAPLVVALNMMDSAESQGLNIDVEALESRLGCPVVPMVAAKGVGMADLKAAILRVAADHHIPEGRPEYAPGVEAAVEELMPVATPAAERHGVDARWLAVKLLEDDELARELAPEGADEILARVVPTLEADLDEDADILVADGRYGFVHTLVHDAVTEDGRPGHTTSDAIDRFVLNGWLGLPVFLGVMYLMFMFTINLGGAFIDFFDMAAATIFVDGVKTVLQAIGAPVWIQVLLADGIGGGIQVVATFVPIIGFLYLFMSFLEDSGYMARAAFLMDRYMRAVGLPGKSFVPLIVGFGCNVPAVMASRTLEQQRDRLMSVLMTPFMSCGARLAVYALFVAAFFPTGGQNVVFALYLIGILVAVGTGLVLKHTLLRGETTHFVMELPPYRLPRAKGVVLHAWSRLQAFMFGAGKIIVMVVVVLSFLNSWGTDGSFGNEDSDRSVLSAIGRSIVPVFEPMGIHDDNWPATVGIFTGVFAKEAVVGTLDALYAGLADGAGGESEEAAGYDLFGGLGEAVATIPENLSGLAGLLLDPLGLGSAAEDAAGIGKGTYGAMAERFDGTVGAFAYLLFILLYTPCVAAIGAIAREVGGRWATFATLWTTGVAFVVAIGVYQAGTFAEHPGSSAAWLGGLALGLAAVIGAMWAVGRHGDTPRTVEAQP